MDKREKDRLRASEYRRKNPDKIREISRRSYEKAKQDPERLERIKSFHVAYRAKNRTSLADRERERRFGIDRAAYAEIFMRQNGVCAICAKPETATRGGKPKALAVDHCHMTGKVRELLCSACNTAIGKMKEDRNILLSAIRYLDKHKDSSNVSPFERAS